ncbi:uncharacterized protein At5g08430-like [Rutidosis leptorrhynchoides]|uniref:uncharacterized protein At5g08430-like n=1 Tax=Rutidosis leptorrhynchoides TaxID=125765 RepID=UPI003A9A151C
MAIVAGEEKKKSVKRRERMPGGGQSSFWVEERHVVGDAAGGDDDFTPFTFTPKRKFLRPSKKMKMEYTGWGSTALIRFLKSLGHDVSNKISRSDVTSLIDNYVNENRLLHPTKKKRIDCDPNLFSIFGKKNISRVKIYDLLEQHFTENKEDSSSDDTGSGEDDYLLNFLDEDSKEDGSHHKKDSLPKTEAPPKKRKGFAAIIPENIKLLYLKRSLIEELLIKDPCPIFEAKMVGSFIRIKNDPNDYLQKSSHQLVQVRGVKEITDRQGVAPRIVFEVFNYSKDIPFSIISDDNFTEEECESLHQKVIDGLLKKPTIVEFEEKVRALHEDITKHWLDREIPLLQKLIDRANEKGWRKELFEYMERKTLLQKPDEKSRLLREIPYVIAEEVKVEPTPQKSLLDGEQQGSRDSSAPIIGEALETPTGETKKANNSTFWTFSVAESSTFAQNLQANEKPVGSNIGLSVSVPSEIPTADDVAKSKPSPVAVMAISTVVPRVSIQALENIQPSIQNLNDGTILSLNLDNPDDPIRAPQIIFDRNENNDMPALNLAAPARIVIDLSDDEEEGEEEGTDDSVVLDPPQMEDLQCLEWHYVDPQGIIQGPFSLISLKQWWDAEYFPLDFKVWKGNKLNNHMDAVYLIDVIRTAFPKQS